MAILEIPTRNDFPAFDMTIALDGSLYVIDFHYNARMGLWVMGIATEDGTDLITGVPVLTDWPLLVKHIRETLPPGIIFAYDTEGDKQDSGRDDLGDRVIVLYQEEDS